MVAVMLALAVAVATVAASPVGSPPQKILIPAVRAEQGVPQGSANLLGEILVEDLARSGQYEALSNSDIATVLGAERQRQLAGCKQEASCLAEIGNALGASLVLEASVGAIGQMRVLALKLVDTQRAQVKGRVTETVQDDDALIDATHRLVSKLMGLPLVESSAKRGLAPGWFVLGGGAVVAAAGGVVGLLALGDYNAFKQDPFNDALGDSAKTKANVADGLYATGAVTAGVGVVLLLLDRAGAKGATP